MTQFPITLALVPSVTPPKSGSSGMVTMGCYHWVVRQDDTKNPSPKLPNSSPSAPNAPSKTPSTKDTSSSSIDYIPKSPTSSTSPSPNGYLNPSTSPPPRVSPPPPTQDNASMGITLTLSPNTPLDVQFDTPSPSPPIIAHPIPWNFLEAHALFPSDPSSIPQVQEKNTSII
ncbi:hypothetical protein Tco_0923342 [Tanacetum coccineum]|uniref:Uncharacterized protein n=1 Tax=Tanacetum coccineum TaxID=301880 RepID=A0ABQ5D421_9ASTR